jgi:hypothetical protein
MAEMVNLGQRASAGFRAKPDLSVRKASAEILVRKGHKVSLVPWVLWVLRASQVNAAMSGLWVRMVLRETMATPAPQARKAFAATPAHRASRAFPGQPVRRASAASVEI